MTRGTILKWRPFFIEESEVVGIESHRRKLINWLIEGPSNQMVFSVVGIGGLAKTILKSPQKSGIL